MQRKAQEFCRVFPQLEDAISKGDYLRFKFYYHKSPRPGDPNIIGSDYDSCPAVNSFSALGNFRIIAELLRDKAELEYIVIGRNESAFLPHRAVIGRKWPLACLLLYVRGIEPFTTIRNCEGKTAMEKWISYGFISERHPCTKGYEFLEKVNRQKALIAEGDLLCGQQKPFEAFKKYNEAACMVLDFHQGDANLVPFYQEEAIAPFYKAVQALIQDFTQAMAPTTHLYDTANIKAGKQTHLVFYVSDVLKKLGPASGLDLQRDKDKMVDRALLTCFTDIVRTWQLPRTPVIWSDPALADYNPYRPRSGSGDSRDSAVGGSTEKLA